MCENFFRLSDSSIILKCLVEAINGLYYIIIENRFKPNTEKAYYNNRIVNTNL